MPRRIKLRIGSTGGLTVNSQSIDFGRKTLSGAGATGLVSTGGSITSITLGTRTTGSNHFTTSGATIVPSAVPTDAQYVWTGCTATGPGGTSAPFTLTINTIANGWSVTDITELTAALQHASLAYGDQVLLRTADYNPSAAIVGFTRSSAPSGTFTQPSDKSPSHQGKNLDSGTYVVVTPHSGASPIIHYYYVANGNGCIGFRFKGLTFYRAPNAADTPYNNKHMFEMDGKSDIAIDGCAFSSNPSSVDGTDCYCGIKSVIGVNRIYVQDNSFDGICTNINLGAAIGNYIIGNTTNHSFDDCIKMGPGTGTKINWNTMHNSGQLPDVLGAHPDYIQMLFDVGGATIDGIEAIGNRGWRGAGLGSSDGQGVFMSNLTTGTRFTNVVVAGNFFSIGLANGISLTNCDDAIIEYNTIVNDLSMLNAETGIYLTTCNRTAVRRNVTNLIDTSGDATATLSNNDQSLTYTNTATYTALFASPVGGSSLTNPDVSFAAKSGGALDGTNIGAIGHVDYAARTLGF